MRVPAGFSKSGLAAVGVIVAVIAVVVGRQYSQTELEPLEPPTPRNRTVFTKWSGPLQPDWDRFTLTPFSDARRVREQLTLLVNEAQGPPPFEVTRQKREALVDALTTFFEAWSSDSAAQYLRKIAPRLRPLAHPRDGSGAVMGCYKTMTGKVMSADVTAEEALDVYWRGRPDCPGKPAAGSFATGEAVIDFLFTDTEGGPRGSHKWGRFADDDLSGRWIGPMSQAVPHVTEPPVSYEAVSAAHGPILEQAFMALVVEPDWGDVEPLWGLKRFVMHVEHYWSPDDGQWYLKHIGFVTEQDVYWGY